MKSYRVILANQPRLLRGLLHRVLRKAPDIEVVGEVTDLEHLRPEVKQTEAQWVIVSMWRNGNLPEPLGRLMAENPALCLMGMAADGSQAKIRCPGGAEQAVRGLSLEAFFAALRSQEPMEHSAPERP